MPITHVEQLVTPRLILRRWRESDLEPFAILNSDREVMEFFPSTLDIDQTLALIERSEKSFRDFGMGLWAVDEKESGEFIGCVGLIKPRAEAPFTPCEDVGWRLAKKYWGRGYAVEAAHASMKDGFERVGLAEIIAVTAELNLRSMRVMEKLKMTRDRADDFIHPVLEENSPLRPHVMYRMKREQFAALD
jgi:RimJ/RimL family protein N-acetyltransferase